MLAFKICALVFAITALVVNLIFLIKATLDVWSDRAVKKKK